MLFRKDFSPPSPRTESWFQYELDCKLAILNAFWTHRIVNYNKDSVDQFKARIIYFRYPVDKKWEHEIEKLFEDAITNSIPFQTFYEALKLCSFDVFISINQAENLISNSQGKYSTEVPVITGDDLANLHQYILQKNISASITLGTVDELITPEYSENHSSKCFAEHSVGKVFTGILSLLMIREGVLSEAAFNEIIELNPEVLNVLPPKVSDWLKQVTLHQVMIHNAGLGDYLGLYMQAIDSQNIPAINRIEDFLPFVDDRVFTAGEYQYSNTGILLLGFAIKHAFEKQFGPCDYNDILRKYIILPADLKTFSSLKPANGAYCIADTVAPYIAGSPAGGYWISAEDLAKFGQWIYQECVNDPSLMSLIEKYGQEFYSKEDQIISHHGGIQSSSAYLSVSFRNGAVLAVMSDQPRIAFDLKLIIKEKILNKPSVKWKWGDGLEAEKYVKDCSAKEQPGPRYSLKITAIDY